MNNWIVGTVLAATVIGGGGAIYMIAVPPPVPATSETSKASPAQGKQRSGPPTEGQAKEKTADAVQPGQATSPPPAQTIVALGPSPTAMLRFRIEVARTDQPGLGTTWTAACPRLAMATIDGCRATNDRRKANEAASGVAIYDDGDERLGFVRDVSMTGTRLSPGVGVALPPGVDYPIYGRGTLNPRWAIPVDDWKKGVTFRLVVSRLENVGTTMKWSSQDVGKARITLID